jgi:hypothetical protein
VLLKAWRFLRAMLSPLDSCIVGVPSRMGECSYMQPSGISSRVGNTKHPQASWIILNTVIAGPFVFVLSSSYGLPQDTQHAEGAKVVEDAEAESKFQAWRLVAVMLVCRSVCPHEQPSNIGHRYRSVS